MSEPSEDKCVPNAHPIESLSEDVNHPSFDDVDGNTMDVEDKVTIQTHDSLLPSTNMKEDNCLRTPEKCKEKNKNTDAELNLNREVNSSYFVGSRFQVICESEKDMTAVKNADDNFNAGTNNANYVPKGDNKDGTREEVISTYNYVVEIDADCVKRKSANSAKGDEHSEIQGQISFHINQPSVLERSENIFKEERKFTEMNTNEHVSTMETKEKADNLRSERLEESHESKSQMALKRKLCDKTCEKIEQSDCRLEVKKSRKQSVPKRLIKTMSDPDGEEGIQMLIENMAVKENHKQLCAIEKAASNEEACPNEKSEKSRKQVYPKRILIEQDVDQTDGRLYESFEKSEDMITEVSAAEIENQELENLNSEPNDLGENCEKEIEPDFDYEMLNFKTAAVPDFEKQLFALGCSADNIDLLSKFSPSMLKSTLQANMASPLAAELQNMEYIRQMREVRTSRYRKISIAEKREISDYAKENGVSVAANFFNVSKSAVSMWSRTDFDEVERVHFNRKRNCMLGNEKFEALCARVRLQKENKFRDLSKQDKIEASRYAKLVGVREMARCLDVALGTISGWMRQFPYVVKADLLEESSSQENSRESISYDGDATNIAENSLEENSFDSDCCEDLGLNEISSFECAMTESSSDNVGLTGNKRKRKSAKAKNLARTVNGNMTNTFGSNLDKKLTSSDEKVEIIKPKKRKSSASSTSVSQEENVLGENHGNLMHVRNFDDNDIAKDALDYGVEQEEGLLNLPTHLQEEDLDQLIADTLYKEPDVDALYEDKKDLMSGTELEGDEHFKELFTRVIKCRSQKYKNLSPRDKMDVCLYGKRSGVRRVGKVLGLATGTLSGWNTKYQVFLNDPNSATRVRDPAVNYGKLSVSDICQQIIDNDMSLDGNVQAGSSTQKSDFDLSDIESAEVSAVKCLFKEKYAEIKKTVEVARTMKFKNMTSEQKIEIVKCAKLIGIRPTARVLNVPIGTLSGWISKYSGDLHPIYNMEKSLSYGDLNSSLNPSWPYLFKDPGGFLPTMVPSGLFSSISQSEEHSLEESADFGSDSVINSNSANDMSNSMNFE
ncbi:hypothetical protein DPMN_031185 [Dreissena polymorpha]|uniref:Uncharacterized protein n=1 Tax=Dreissena polymorpha TaxID=45954 RepID=A0A9D4RH30_DREPO|nr:hypothetical protein DPMN_031185 [Dreissena polymorpha]